MFYKLNFFFLFFWGVCVRVRKGILSSVKLSLEENVGCLPEEMVGEAFTLKHGYS